MVLIARSADMLNVTQIAESTGSSRHHVAKVLQRLVKDNFLSSNRGPSGGFTLKKPADQISLLQIYEAIDGVIVVSKCAMDNPICPFERCLTDNIVGKMTLEIKEYLSRQFLASYL